MLACIRKVILEGSVSIEHVPYTAKYLRGNIRGWSRKWAVHGKMFVVAAPFNSECYLLYNIRG